MHTRLMAALLVALAVTPSIAPAQRQEREQEVRRRARDRQEHRQREMRRERDEDTDEDTDDEDTERKRRGRRFVCVDRNGDGICDNRDRRDDRCVDTDRDGFCDGPRRDDDDFCLDQDGDGRCDSVGFPSRFPRTLPVMITVDNISRGRRTADVNRWLGGARLRLRYSDVDNDGRPEVVRFLDPSGRVVQVWFDTDHDGRADRVEIFRDGKLARTITP